MSDNVEKNRRKAIGAEIDIEACPIHRSYVQVLDPYGERELLPEEQQIGADLFALSEPHNEWIWEGDLPDDKRQALHERFKREGETDPFEAITAPTEMTNGNL